MVCTACDRAYHVRAGITMSGGLPEIAGAVPFPQNSWLSRPPMGGAWPWYRSVACALRWGVDMRRPGCQGGPGDGDGLLERAEQLALLSEVLATVADGRRGRAVLAAGEAGIGKTTLLRRFSDSVAGRARTLWAACDHLFIPRPLGPFLDLAEAVGGRLAVRVADAARPYDVAAALLADLGSRGTAVLVLEDVHWADEASLDVIRLLARRIEAVPALLALSYRDDELDRSHPLRLVLGDLSGGGQVTRVELAGLS